MKRIIFSVLLLLCLNNIAISAPIVINDIEIPEDLYKEISDFNNKMWKSIAGGWYDETNITMLEILQKLSAKVKVEKVSYCPVCDIEYPVGKNTIDTIQIDYNKKYDHRICLDSLPLNVSYKLPTECLFCGGIIPKFDLNSYAQNEKSDIWRVCRNDLGIIQDKWDIYIACLETLALENHFNLVETCLKASRSYSNNEYLRKAYLERALKHLQNYFEEEKANGYTFSPDNSLNSNVLLKKADILRQSGYFEEAASITADLKNKVDNKYSYLRVELDFLDNLIFKQNTKPAIRPFGNKLHIAIHNNSKIKSDILSLVSYESIWQNNMYGLSALKQAIVEKRVNYVKLFTDKKYNVFKNLDSYQKSLWHALIKRINNDEITKLIENALERSNIQ